MVKNKEKKYAFNISLQAFDLDYTVNEHINFEPFQADDIDELFELLQPIWLENHEKILDKYSDNSDVSLTLHCDEVIRNSDGDSDIDDPSIPQSAEVADELIERLDNC